ncbi:DUF2922 domain-containing protein [Enterococcus pallens]|uniref:DUF2922 family protein n=1 Tax=Enterococcus pallens ATCC BAA-351 TaxID=1158607 RepID=R2PUY5_9ENTE|nr:DUF2922 domain-containing protein [Enterococcus pallens]EOH88372.1 hypothetical protein UAU_04190 [Enterococcus pallens ATCC BAA-351]EOU17553.1 hypothetical protein I588_02539 [Enterococcus pallens ATCC BAA-351]
MKKVVKLVSIFRNGMGKNQTWSLSNPDTTKTPSQIKALLEEMAKLNLFHKDGIRQYEFVVSAKYVETIETPIFEEVPVTR